MAVNELPRGAPLPVASNWYHSMCDLIKVDCEWTIHQFKFRDDVEQSIEFPVGDASNNSGGMTWKLIVNGEGIHIAQSICRPGQPVTYSGTCTKNFRVTLGIVDSNREKDIIKDNLMVRKGTRMPVNIYQVPRNSKGVPQWNEDEEIVMENGNVDIYCEIETYINEKELMGRSVNVVGPRLSNKKELVNHFEELFENMKFSDVTFNVRGQEFRAHKAILSVRSPVFAAMFQHQTKENVTGSVDVHDIEPEVFNIMLRYIYTGQVLSRQMEEVATELLSTADKYLLGKLKYECGNHLDKKMSPKNCFKLLSLDKHDPAYYLKEKALDYIRRNPSKVMSLGSWKKASKENPIWIVRIKEMLLETIVSNPPQ